MTAARDAWVAQTLGGLSLEQQIGQLIVQYVYGPDADQPDPRNLQRYGVATPAEVVTKYQLGGVIYFAWSGNTVEPVQVQRLSNGLQRAALATRSGIPLDLSTDQETGRVARIGPPVTEFPGAMALGAGESLDRTREVFRVTGRELAAMGISTDYAPDADVNVNPDNPVIGVRSFGARPADVARHVAAAVLGLHVGGVGAAAKHFPGHGDTGTDSHTALPVINHTLEQWRELDKPPFVAAIAAGVDEVMTAHLAFPALDPSGDPATLSAPILTGLLRDELGYQGVVVTDSLEMAGVRARYDDGEIAVRAIEAGVDLLLMPADPDAAPAALLAAVGSGRISAERLAVSVRRVLAMKYDSGLVARPLTDPAELAGIGSSAHLAVADAAAQAAVMLQGDDEGLVPLAGSVLVVGADPAPVAALTGALAAAGTIARAAVVDGATGQVIDHAALGRVAVVRPDHRADTMKAVDPALDDELVAAVGSVDCVVLLAAAVSNQPWTSALAAALPKSRLIVVGVRDPQDAELLGNHAGAVLLTYSSNAVAMRALAQVLTGARRATGRSPMWVPPGPSDVVADIGDRFTVRPRPAGRLELAPMERAWRRITDFARPTDGGRPLFPGAVLCYGHQNGVIFTEATGYAVRYAHVDGTEFPTRQQIPTADDTIFDLASITKLFTSIVIMQLAEKGLLELDRTMAHYLPEFAAQGKAPITLRMLLTHTSGFAAEIPLWRDHPDRVSRVTAVLTGALVNAPGSTYLYSDLNLISLGVLAERVTGRGLDELVADGITRPLILRDTGFNPDPVKRLRIAATEEQSVPPRGLVWGQVHDENAASLDGVAGHAGLFSTAADLAELARTLLGGGVHPYARILTPDSVRQLIANENAGFPGHDHGLGFELNQRWYMGDLAGLRTAGHTGYTGTSLVLDFDRDAFVILLTNRVHPSRHWGSPNPARVIAAQGMAEALGLSPA